jgi:hypothetical protein
VLETCLNTQAFFFIFMEEDQFDRNLDRFLGLQVGEGQSFGPSDTADVRWGFLQIYGPQLECTGWTVDEKLSFLADEGNREFLREFSAARRREVMKALAEHLAFD